MTTKTPKINDLLDKLKNVDPDDLQQVTETVALLSSSVYLVRLALKSRAAAKAGDWDKATYYAVALVGGQSALRFRITEMRRRAAK